MIHGQKAPPKPLFTDKKSADIFINLFIEDYHKRVAKALFVEGLTNEETANKIGYSKRQIERLRIYLMRAAVKRLIEKQIPKKPIKLGLNPLKLICSVSYVCPHCNKHISITPYCSTCGQALDWGDTE